MALVLLASLSVACPSTPQTPSGLLEDVDAVDVALDASAPDVTAQPEVDGGAVTDPVLDDDARFFDVNRVYDVEITLAPEDWDTLRLQTRSLDDILGGEDCLDGPVPSPFTWFEADVVIDGLAVSNVAVRKKGFLGSLDPIRPSLKVKLDQFVEGQDLGGMTRWTLNNARQDPAKINQCITYAVYEAAGVPAPRCSYVHLYVNGTDMGLYVNVESIKKDFLRRHFDYEGGNLYEGALSDLRDGWLDTFARKTNEEDPDRADLLAAQAAAEAPDSDLLEQLDAVIDLDLFYSMWAVDVVTNHVDGYAQNTNNYYLYRDLDGRFTFIPWGADNTLFWDPNGNKPASVMASGMISRRLYLHPQGQAAYLQRLQEVLDTAWDEDALLAEIDRQEALIRDHVLPEQRVELQARIQTKRSFVQSQRARIEAELAAGPVAWQQELREPPCFVEQGTLDVTFSTTWGTLPQENLFATGTSTITLTVGGAPWGVPSGGAKSGSEKPGEAQLVIAGPLDPATSPGGVFAAVVVVPMDYFTTGAELGLNFATGFGQAVRFYEGATEPEYIGMLFGGTLTLTSAGTQPGAPVTGRLVSPIITIGGGP